MNNDNLDQKINESWDNSDIDPNRVLANTDQISKPKLSFLNEELVDPFEEAKNKTQEVTSEIKQEPKVETGTLSEIPRISEENKVPESAENILEPKAAEPIIPSSEPQPSKIEEKNPIVENPIPEETKTETKPQKAPAPVWKTVLKIIAIFIGVTIFVYIFINFSAFWEKITYLINPPKYETVVVTKVSDKDLTVSTTQEIFTSFLSTAFKQPIKYTETKTTSTQQPSQTSSPEQNNSSSTSASDIANNTLIIPKLAKTAPIIWNSAPDESVMLENLQKGVVHYAGTPLPGEGKGPIFISGHSSYYSWDPGQYKTVFTNLDKLSQGDIIQIKYNDQIFTYQVYETVVVNPDQVDVLNATSEPTLDLMTCVPVGTNQQRLIVKAKQI